MATPTAIQTGLHVAANKTAPIPTPVLTPDGLPCMEVTVEPNGLMTGVNSDHVTHRCRFGHGFGPVPTYSAAPISYGQPSTTIIHHRAFNREAATAELPFGGTLSFVVVTPTQGAALLKDEPQTHANAQHSLSGVGLGGYIVVTLTLPEGVTVSLTLSAARDSPVVCR